MRTLDSLCVTANKCAAMCAIVLLATEIDRNVECIFCKCDHDSVSRDKVRKLT